MDDLLGEFLTETSENIAVLDSELVKLEQNPDNPSLLDNIFRLVHTIKGTCGFLGLPRLEAVAHAAENVLGCIRDGRLPVTSAAISLTLQSLDRIKAILAALEATEAEPEGDDLELIAELNALAAEVPGTGLLDGNPAEGLVEEIVFEVAPPPEAVAEAVAEIAAAIAAEAPPRPAKGGEMPGREAGKEAGKEIAESAIAAQSIRVSVEVLDTLMAMVSELVLTRNQLLQILRSHSESAFTAPLQRLSQVTSELQEGVMKTRMQPIGNAWSKLPRIVRDLAHELGKKIDLDMRGAETELDRQVLDLIKDPLTHMVRNSADHGIEAPGDRAGEGKPETGTITLSACHEGGHIILEIGDDGRGLDVDRIREKALAVGLAGEAELAAMTAQQLHQFIFRAGFSTAKQVTSTSGRGVGMDVVRANIEKIGGTIDLKSQKGKGSTFTIKIPLTLAIVSALIVECAGERFAVPQIAALELVRVGAGSEHTIEWLNDTPVLRLRNRLLPLVSLKELLRLGKREEMGGETFVVVTQAGTSTFGITVDRVFDTEEIVVKPVAPLLRHIGIFSGNTILGDGSVIMILDPNGIAAASSQVTVAETTARREQPQRSATRDRRTALLLFRTGSGAPKAVPLGVVARLEEVDLAAVEQANGRSVIQYRGRLMPLVTVPPGMVLASSGRRPVLVFSEGGNDLGLVAEEIDDIVEEELKMEMVADRPGLIGSAILAGRATEIIDAGYYLKEGGGHAGLASPANARDASRRILLVDQSPFFRNLLTPLLTAAGYEVTSVDSGEHALALCEAGEDFDAIVSDAEMQDMDAGAFASTVREGRWRDKPLLALASRGAEHPEEAQAAGYSGCVGKLDREALLGSLADVLRRHGGAA